MGIISKFGHWLDTRFPERIPVEEVMKSLTAYAQVDAKLAVMEGELLRIRQKLEAFTTGAQAFEKSQNEFKDEINKIKAVQAMTNRIRTTSPLPTGEAWKR